MRRSVLLKPLPDATRTRFRPLAMASFNDGREGTLVGTRTRALEP